MIKHYENISLSSTVQLKKLFLDLSNTNTVRKFKAYSQK